MKNVFATFATTSYPGRNYGKYEWDGENWILTDEYKIFLSLQNKLNRKKKLERILNG